MSRADFTVPAPVMRGRMAPPPPGQEEGEQCLRIDGRGETCLGKLSYQQSAAAIYYGCSCWRSAPCWACMATASECDRCGWRGEEPL